MTAQLLSRELETIIQESKKKHADLKNAAEKSLRELKALPVTSEAQFTADIRRRPQFANPILSACRVGTAKLTLPGIICLQRLVTSGSLAGEKLQELLEVFLECSKTNPDVQLRILQSLPSLLQNYPDDLEGDLQASILQVCTRLQQAKSVAVSSTSAATLQQVISFVFEKVEREDAKAKSVPASAKVDLDYKSLSVRPAAHDAFRVLHDICLLTEGQQATFMPGAIIQQSFGLELIEAILSNHGDIFDTHKELAYLLRSRIMPLVTHFLSDRLSFALTVRTTRLLCIALREHLDLIKNDCDIPLSLLNHLLDSDGSSSNWRRALCMETFRLIYCTPNLVTSIYSLFDQNPDRRNLIQENLAHFVRLAAEKPALIGVGPQSSYPAGPTVARNNTPDQAVIEAGTVAGIISGDLGVSETNAIGISTQWSTMKTPCLDVLDKSDPPTIPETYIYSLVLTCLNGLSDGLARVALPLTVQNRSKPDATPVEPTDSTDDVTSRDAIKGDLFPLDTGLKASSADAMLKSPQMSPVTPEKATKSPVAETVSHLVNECWPAMLASSSTFLFAALDADFYRTLIRSVQKFTQVAGLLKLATPRDAFLTTLAKSAIPANLAKLDGVLSPSSTTSPRIGSTDGFFTDVNASKTFQRRASFDSAPASLSQRNLMCLRALINLAIALGSTLNRSWSIIIESLQKADSILAQSETTTSREYRSNAASNDRLTNDHNAKQSGLNTEISAVEAAITRLLQSTVDFPAESFLHVLQAFCDLVGGIKEPSTPGASSNAGSIRLPRRTSNSTLSSPPANQNRSVHFAISKLGELARINIGRFAVDHDSAAWILLSDKLRGIATSPIAESTSRLMAADIIGSMALGITTETMDEEVKTRQEIQLRTLASLDQEVKVLYETLETNIEPPSAADIDVQRAAIEALRAILENCGDSIIAGWRSIFSIVQSTFTLSHLEEDEEEQEEGENRLRGDFAVQMSPQVKSPKIARSAFACVQLICSDFLQSLRRNRFINLIDILCQFCGQKGDLNISLTTVTLFWNLSDFLQKEAPLASAAAELFDSNGNIPSEIALIEAAEGGSFPAMWMIIQSRLALLTLDDRVEVRNGAVQTIFRILSSSSDKLSAQLWAFSFQKVIIELLRVNVRSHQKCLAASKGPDWHNEAQLESTTDMVLKGLANTLTSNLQALTSLPIFETTWRALLDQFSPLFVLGSNEVYASIFDFLSQILAVAGTNGMFSSKSIGETMAVLQRNLPKARNTNDPAGNEKALLAYVGSLKRMYALMSGSIGSDQIVTMVENLHNCILSSTAQPYSSDVENPSALQASVLDGLGALRTDLSGLSSVLIKHVSSLIKLPYDVLNEPSTYGGLTFVAFSKEAMNVERQLIVTHSNDKEIYNSGALHEALKALCVAISFKYQHNRQGKEPSMWQKATTSAIELLPNTLPHIGLLSDSLPVKTDLLSILGVLKTRITNANLDVFPVSEILLSDEAFDLKASDYLRKCLGIRKNIDELVTHPLLKSITTPAAAKMRANYVQALFNNSLIHESISSSPIEPVEGLYKIRSGQTWDPQFSRRIRMSYDCLDELFALASKGLNDADESLESPISVKTKSRSASHSEGTNGIATSHAAQAALPNAAFEYLVLRCALPLKRYIADQPLRGKMPAPTSQRLELLYILRKMRDLDCIVGRDMDEYMQHSGHELKFRIPVIKPWKRHLEWLLPLVNMASVSARRDAEIADALQQVIDVAISR